MLLDAILEGRFLYGHKKKGRQVNPFTESAQKTNLMEVILHDGR